MKVRDLNGKILEVTCLKKALKITRLYKEYRHTAKSFTEFDKRQNTYWTDLYEKLSALQERLHKTKKR